MKTRLFHTVLVLLLCLTLSRCGLTGGNAQEHIDTAVRTVEEQYGVHLTVTKKNPFPGGVNCDVTVSCQEVPGKGIRVFWFNENERVSTDFIYQKYGDEAFRRISAVAERVQPDAKIVVVDTYNHLISGTYDQSTTLDDYLQENQFKVYFIFGDIPDEDTMRNRFAAIVEAFLADGINCRDLTLYAMKTPQKAAAVKTFSYIAETTEASIVASSEDIALQAMLGTSHSIQEWHDNPERKTLVY